jgi:translation initiation factor IF-3
MKNRMLRGLRQKPRDPIAESVVYNQDITPREVLLVDNSGRPQSMTTAQAMRIAQDQGLDLVLVNAQAQPPVAKIMDAKKHIYNLRQAKKEQDRSARQNAIHVKEIQLRPVTDSHDLAVKQKNAQMFLNEQNKVKVVVKFRGREVRHSHIGIQLIQTFINGLENYKLEKIPEMQGNHITAIISPVK